MSEYWKSTPKYWCKHCSAYVKDTPFERKQHESTGKHQGNLKRFLRDIQNNHERGEREKDRAKSEVERLKGVAGADPTKLSTPSTPSQMQTHSAQKSGKGPQSVADRKKQWTQLAQMGIQVPEDFRSEMAMAGDWQKSSEQVVNEPPPEAPLSTGIKKRKYEGQEEDEEEKHEAGEAVVRRGWGAATRTYPGRNNADLEDLLSGSISIKKNKAGCSRLPVKNEDSKTQDQGSTPAHNDEEDKPGSQTPPNMEESPHDNTFKHENLEIKSESTQGSRSLNQVPEAFSMPLFKKRMPKGLSKG